MFFDKQSNNVQSTYMQYLECAGMMSALSSTSSTPYIVPRQAENIFCIAFDAENLSRSDCSADAKKGNVGIGIKTFINGNGSTLQKIAEFNKDASRFRGKSPREMVRIIANLRNERIRSTMRIYGLYKMIYHCIVRNPGEIIVYECAMDEIDISNIKNIIENGNGATIAFEDGINEYSFNLSKSTLYKRFITNNELCNIKTKILSEPYSILREILIKYQESHPLIKIVPEAPHIILPLFSDRGKRNVPERSGLNQWNANGRARDYDEIYIPIPAWIHVKFPDFFPNKDTPFNLRLPDGKILNVKLCQQGSKALMSNPNAALGKWLLRDALEISTNELLTYSRLEQLNIDSVEIVKTSNNEYSIDFMPLGTYDAFLEDNK